MIRSLLWKLSRMKSGPSRRIRDLAAYFLDSYNDFNYDFDENGERLLMDVLRKHSIDVVFDVGANVGDWSRIATAAFPNAQIHAFELSERTREELKRNLQGPQFNVSEHALGRSAGEIKYKDYGASHSIVNTMIATTYHDDRLPFTERKATLLTGDSYMTQHGIAAIDLLKIDVEGAELDVLAGFEQAISNHAIRVIQFEYGYSNGDAGHLMKDFYQFLVGNNYRVGRLWSAGVRFSDFQYEMNNFTSGPNYLAVASGEAMLIEALQSPV